MKTLILLLSITLLSLSAQGNELPSHMDKCYKDLTVKLSQLSINENVASDVNCESFDCTLRLIENRTNSVNDTVTLIEQVIKKPEFSSSLAKAECESAIKKFRSKLKIKRVVEPVPEDLTLDEKIKRAELKRRLRADKAYSDGWYYDLAKKRYIWRADKDLPEIQLQCKHYHKKNYDTGKLNKIIYCSRKAPKVPKDIVIKRKISPATTKGIQ